MKLRDAFDSAITGNTTGWLFLPADYKRWTLETDAWFVDLDALEVNPENDEPVLPADIIACGFKETIDVDTIADCTKWADSLSGGVDPNVRLKSFIYYVRFDAFLPSVDASDPHPWEETRKKLDREFYDRLGPEDRSQPCRTAGCLRGSIKSGVMCKRHHFEMIHKRECPFTE